MEGREILLYINTVMSTSAASGHGYKTIKMEDSDDIKYLPITSGQTLINCKALDVTNISTVFVASYPKSGTTW
jgi:hypothetical protein